MRRLPRIAIAAVLCLAATCFVSVGEAASPTKNGLYEGKAKGSVSRPDVATVRIKVSGNGKTLKFRGPHERCGGFNPLSAFFPVIEKVKIAKDGSFKGKRTYKDTSRGPNYILDWKVELSGRFSSTRKATGKVNYEMAHQGRSPTRQQCGKRKVTWSAKRTG